MPAPRYGPAYRRSHECCLRRCRHDARTPIGEGMFREARWWTAIVKPVRPRAATWEQRYSARLCRTTDPGARRVPRQQPDVPTGERPGNASRGSKCAMSGSHTTLRSCATSAGSDRTRVSPPVSGATTSRSEDGSSEYASPRISRPRTAKAPSRCPPRSRFDCGDQQTATSTATGNQEQPAFFGQKRCGSRESFGSRVTAVGDSVDQVDQRFGTQ